MKYTLILFLALIGCATPGELAKREPNLQFDSDKTPIEVSSCITQKWQETWNTTTNTPQENGFMIVVGNPMGGTPATARVLNHNGKTEVKVHAQFSGVCSDKICESALSCR